MLTAERKRLILDLVRKEGQVLAKSLSVSWGLSEDTIRRDLRELAAEGLVQRVHGGALPASATVADLTVRRGVALAEKARLGRRGASLLGHGQSAFIDGGTTNLELVRNLPPDLQATVYTHSPEIACALERHTGIDVIVIGGRLFRHSMVAVGALAMDLIARLRVDLFFLGVTGIHATSGLTTGDFEEAFIKRAMIERSADIVSLVTAEKVGAISPHTIAPASALTTVIATKEAPEQALAGLPCTVVIA